MFSLFLTLLVMFLKGLKGNLFALNSEIDFLLKEEASEIPYS